MGIKAIILLSIGLALIGCSQAEVTKTDPSPTLSTPTQDTLNASLGDFVNFSQSDLETLIGKVSAANNEIQLRNALSLFSFEYPEYSDFKDLYRVYIDAKNSNCHAGAIVEGLEGFDCVIHSDEELAYLNFLQFKSVKDAIKKCAKFKCSEIFSKELENLWTFPRFVKIRALIELDVGVLSKKGKLRCGLNEHLCHDENATALNSGVFFTDHLIFTFFEDAGIDAYFGLEVHPLACTKSDTKIEYSNHLKDEPWYDGLIGQDNLKSYCLGTGPN